MHIVHRIKDFNDTFPANSVRGRRTLLAVIQDDKWIHLSRLFQLAWTGAGGIVESPCSNHDRNGASVPLMDYTVDKARI